MPSTQEKTHTPDNDSLIGQTLHNHEYHVQRVLGMGGMGKVYLATHTTLDTSFALKQARADQPLPDSVITELDCALRPGDTTQQISTKPQSEADFSTSGGLLTDRFLREALLLARLQHGAIPTLYDYFFQDGYWYLVMDYIPGPTLSAYLRQHAPLPTLEALNYAMQLCDVLDYLHRQPSPIIFRDLKPSNIILAPNGSLMLVDFGIARYYKPDQLNDTTEFGSPGYASPEQYEGQTDGRSDLFSLGVILHEMITGKRPSASSLTQNVRERLVSHNSALLSGLITLATRAEPMYRFQSAYAFYLALERAYIIEERRAYQRHVLRTDHTTESSTKPDKSKAPPPLGTPPLQTESEQPALPLNLSQRLRIREALHQARQERREEEHLEVQLASVEESLKRRSFGPLSQVPSFPPGITEGQPSFTSRHRQVHWAVRVSFMLALSLFLAMVSLLTYVRYWHHIQVVPQAQPTTAIPTVTASTHNPWQVLPSLPSAEADNTAVYVQVQGRAYIYMSGGFRSQKQPPYYDRELYRYDIAAAHWEAVTNGQFPGMLNNSVVSDGQGHLFFTAGYSTDTYTVTSILYMYQVSDGTVHKIVAPAQAPLGFGGSMIADQQGHLYITQGFMKGGDPTAEVGTGWYRYDIETAQWHALAPLPAELGYMLLTLDGSGNILAMGGASDAAQHDQTDKIYRYNIKDNNWIQEQATAPLPLSGTESCQDQPGQMIVLGGYDAAHDRGLTQSWLVDLATLHWTPLIELPSGGSILGAAACDRAGHIFLERGADDQFHPTQDFWELSLPEILDGFQ